MKQHNFAAKTALVTGGSRGIGRACCLRLAAAGAKVAVNHRHSAQQAEETVQQIREAGGVAEIFQADVAADADVERLRREVEDTLGPVDLLVNNAGVLHMGTHDETTPEVWRQMLDVNLTGTYLVCWAVKPGMIQRGGGRIVNVASIAGLRARPNAIAYAVSKAGVIALTKSLSEALGPHGIRVNAVAPGLIKTQMIAHFERAEDVIDRTPLGRLGTPDDIAAAVCFLLSDEADFITGQTLVASGGRVLLP